MAKDDPKDNPSPDSKIDSEMAPPPRPVRRLGVGFKSISQLMFGFIILIGAFFLGMTYYQRADLTHGQDFSLSDTTKKLLQSDLLQKREEPVKVIAALRKSSPHYARLRALIEEYDHLGGGKLKVDYLDPIRDQDRALEVANNYGRLLRDRLFSDDLFIIDARLPDTESPTLQLPENGTDDEIEFAKMQFDAQVSNSGLRFLPVEQILVKRTDDQKQRRVVGYRDEDFLSAFLLSALEGKPRKMYLIADKSDIDVGEANSPWQVLTEALARQNIGLIPWQISSAEKVPDDAEGVVLVAPRYDLEEKEMAILEEYWSRPGASILATLEPSARPENLRAFFRKHGITPRNDRVLSVKNGRTETQVQALFIPGNEEINAGLADKATTFEGKVCSLEVREGAEDLLRERINCSPLIEAAPGYWGETEYTKPDPKFDAASDFDGALYLAAAVFKGNANDDETAEKISKMIIVSSSDFLHPDRLREEQNDFLKNTSNWLLGREELMGIGPRALERRKLSLIPSEVSVVDRIVVFFIPIGFLILALFVWNTRRA